MSKALSVLLVGAGKMGGALLTAWARPDDLLDREHCAVLDPTPSGAVAALVAQAGVALNPDLNDKSFDVVVLATKPQKLEDATAALPAHLWAGALVVSIAAGKSFAMLDAAAPGARAIIRAMPNLPAAVGAGVTALCADHQTADEHKEIAERLMSAAGSCVWLAEESQIDVATAVSGSGPAYVFLLAECLAGAAQSAGLAPEAAAALARQTVIGAGAMLKAADDTPADLRRAVTSPAGTTDAALKVLMNEPGGLGSLVRDAVRAANARARELNR